MVTTCLSMFFSDPRLTKRIGLHFKHKSKQKSLSYSPVKQYAVDVGIVVQCDECNKWRLFSKPKLACHELEQHISYTCGATMEDLHLPEPLKCVKIRIHHQCCDRIERLYYTAYPVHTLWKHGKYNWIWRIPLPILQWLQIKTKYTREASQKK